MENEEEKVERRKIELPRTYQPKGGLHRKGMPKGFNKCLFLYKSGLKDKAIIKLAVMSHYYALADERGLKGKKRMLYINGRRTQLKNALLLLN